MKNTKENANYIVRGVGHVALLAAIVEQARKDAKGKNEADAEDAKKGIEEWAKLAGFRVLD